MRPALLARLLPLALAAALPAGAEEGAVRAEVQLHLRATDAGNRPAADVRFDPATRTFALAGYLVPQEDERFGSAFAAVRVTGRHLDGALRWTLALDTGELRLRRAPQVVPVCFSSTSPTGLDLDGQAGCTAAQGVYPLPGTALDQAALTANGRPLADELQATLLVREAHAAWSFGRAGFATVRAGRARQVVADGLVHDDYATGLDVALDLGALGPPFELGAAVFQPSRDWPAGEAGLQPVVSLRADWRPSLFEHLGVFVATHRDATGSVADLFRGALVEDAVVQLSDLLPGQPGYQLQARNLARFLVADPSSEATLAWAGLSGSLLPFRGHRLDLTLAVLDGELSRLTTTQGPSAVRQIPLSGRAAHLRWGWSPVDWLTVEPWLLYLSGDRPPTEKARLGLPAGYAGFLGVTPFVAATNLFFSGGLSEGFAARQASAPGVNGRGVLAPGLTVEADLPAEVGLVARAAWLRAKDRGPFGGLVYGTELDLSATWAPLAWLSLGAEADVLLPGDFFGGAAPITKLLLALDVGTP